MAYHYSFNITYIHLIMYNKMLMGKQLRSYKCVVIL